MTATADWLEHAARAFEEPDPLAAIGFEPVCKPRVLERLAGTPEHLLPPLCGTCPQERFLALPDENLDVLFGGAGGGGKSASLLAMAIRTCIRYPGIQVFWFRKTFPQLNQSVLRNLARYNYAKAVGGHWNASRYELTFPSPAGTSILTFAHAKNPEEAAALSSAEINLLIIDERTTMPPDVVDFLYTRIRSGVMGVPCLGARAASNPGHVGHSIVKEGYVDATDHGAREITDKAGRRRIFIPAKASDNPYVGDYDKTLEGISDPDLRARIKDGDWSAMPDAAFPDWKHDLIAVPAFQIPETWNRHGGMDYGWAAPSVYLAAARDGDGRLWFYRELTMIQTPERDQAQQILDANRQDGGGPPRIAADPAMWGKTGSALPPATQITQEGVPLEKADNDRLGGKARMHSYLSLGPACPIHREAGLARCPMLHVLDGSCPKFVKTMGALTRDPRRPEDVDTDGPDHWYDAARYLCLDIGAGPQFPDHDDLPGQNPDEIAGLPVLRPLGVFAVRDQDTPGPDWWTTDTDTTHPVDRIAKTGTAPWHT